MQCSARIIQRQARRFGCDNPARYIAFHDEDAADCGRGVCDEGCFCVVAIIGIVEVAGWCDVGIATATARESESGETKQELEMRGL